MKKERHLKFEELLKEVREHYNNLDNLVNLSDDLKKSYFKRNRTTLEQFLSIILSDPEDDDFSSIDLQLYYSVLGIFYENLMKTCLLKENWNKYILEYISDKRNLTFKSAKKLLNQSLKSKVNEKQHKRLKDIFDFIQLQRNNFSHSFLKGYHHYAVENQMLQSVLVLNKLYNLNFSDDAVFLIRNRINHFIEQPRTDFEDVKLLNLLD